MTVYQVFVNDQIHFRLPEIAKSYLSTWPLAQILWWGVNSLLTQVVRVYHGEVYHEYIMYIN